MQGPNVSKQYTKIFKLIEKEQKFRLTPHDFYVKYTFELTESQSQTKQQLSAWIMKSAHRHTF